MQNGFKLLFVLFQQVQVPKSCEREEDKEEDKEEEKGLVKFPMCSFKMFSIAPHFVS
jgi:hypothetical protein